MIEQAHVPDDVAALQRSVDAAVAAGDLRHVTVRGVEPFPVDVVARVLDGGEWDRVAAGLVQRVRALEAFLRDPSAAVEAGVVPADVVATSIHRAPAGLPPSPVPVGVYGPDLVRGADGELVVLEDNLRTPTLMGYAAAVRRLLPAPPGVRPFAAELLPALDRVLRAAAPDVEEPVVAVLGDDRPYVRVEPDSLATGLGVPSVELRDLRRDDDRLRLPDGRAVDVLWRRTSEERLLGDDGRPNVFGEALLPALRAGTLRVVNPFGTGVADDKRTYAHVEDLVRLHLGEEPLLRSVRAYDLGDPAVLDAVRDRLGGLVLKPRAGSGGRGVAVRPTAADVRAALAEPGQWLAQEPVSLSTCPTVAGDRLELRHVDLRPCVLSDGGEVTVLPGGLTRTGSAPGDLVVNCAQGGRAKDTWVVDSCDSVSPFSDGTVNGRTVRGRAGTTAT